jgi:hypothetical protein
LLSDQIPKIETPPLTTEEREVSVLGRALQFVEIETIARSKKVDSSTRRSFRTS